MSKSTPVNRAGLLQSFYIIVRSVVALGATTTTAVVRALVGKLPRERANRYIIEMADRLLAYVQADCIPVFDPASENLPIDRPIIYMSNHSSLYDIPLIMKVVKGRLRMLTKKELFRIPMFGRAMRAAEFISIDRHNRNQAIKDLEHAEALMLSGLALWAAPEGTRSQVGKLLPFKKGVFMLAMKTNALIVPVGIRGADKILPPKTLKFYLNREIEVHVGAPIDARDYTVETRDALIQRTAQAISELAAVERL